ncbi:MAG: GerMN domain-containing protein [Acidithiobacillales bacterium]
MPRRFALALVGLLVLLLLGFLAGRRVLSRSASRPQGPAPTPTARPTPVVPPNPVPSQRVTLWFEPKDGELFRAEIREIPAAPDEIGFLRALAAAVLEGPRDPDLLRPFPEGWGLRGAYRLRDGLVVLDLAPPAAEAGAASGGPPAPSAGLPPPWQTGTHEELAAAQALLITLAKNVPDVSKVALLVSGEPAETLGGHLDLGHPLVPDLTRASSEPPVEPPAPEETATPLPAPTTAPSPSAPPGAPSPRAPVPTPLNARPGPRTDVT